MSFFFSFLLLEKQNYKNNTLILNTFCLFQEVGNYYLQK